MQEPICPCKSAPATQKVHHILSAICPLKVQKSTEKNTKPQNCRPLQTALLCGFSDYMESCRNQNSIFDSRTGHHTRLLTNGLTKPFVSFYFLPDFGFGLYLVFIAIFLVFTQGERSFRRPAFSFCQRTALLRLPDLSSPVLLGTYDSRCCSSLKLERVLNRPIPPPHQLLRL